MATSRPSRRGNLIRLIAEGADEATALMRLAAFHNNSDQAMTPVRTSDVRAGDQVFPPHQFVSRLVSAALLCLRDLLSASRDNHDDLLVATYGMYLVTAIHPFTDGNGHVALDFGQYLLMGRWQVDAPPLFYQSDTHRTLRIAFAPMDRACSGESGEEVIEATKALSDEMTNATLETLWQKPNLVAATHYLAQASGFEFVARTQAASSA